MTGIERFRELADKYAELGKYHTTIDVVPSGMAMLFSSIANQIEREHAEDCYGMVIDHGTVSRVASEMERHVSGVEGMEDSPVARWARELRRLRDWRDNAEPVYPMTVLLRRCKEFGVDTSDCEDGEDVLNNLIETLRPRLMPEGCEWPTVDGRKVDFKTPYQPSLGVLEAVSIYSNGACEVMSHDGIIKPVSEIHVVVPAADGEPLEVGQTVWDTNGDELVVGALEDGGHTVTCRYADVGDSIPVHGMWSPSDLTHQRPVLDADGVPIREGDTVWLVGGGEPAEVAYTITADASHPDEVVLKGYEDDWPVNADKLTHAKPEPPDSAEFSQLLTGQARFSTHESGEKNILVLVDHLTGVQYLVTATGACPLLDADGTPLLVAEAGE